MRKTQALPLSSENVENILRLLEERRAIPKGAAKRAMADYKAPSDGDSHFASRISVSGAKLFAFANLRRRLEDETGRPRPYPENGLEGILTLELERTENAGVSLRISGKSDAVPDGRYYGLPSMAFTQDCKGEELLEVVRESLGYRDAKDGTAQLRAPSQILLDSFCHEALASMNRPHSPSPGTPFAHAISRLMAEGRSGRFLASRVPCDRSLFEGDRGDGAVYLEGIYDAEAGEAVFHATLRDPLHIPRRLATFRTADMDARSLNLAAKSIDAQISSLMRATPTPRKEALAGGRDESAPGRNSLSRLREAASSARAAVRSFAQSNAPFFSGLGAAMLSLPSRVKESLRQAISALASGAAVDSSSPQKSAACSVMERFCLAIESRAQNASAPAPEAELSEPRVSG